MKYLVTKSYVQVVGKIWMPAITAAMEYKLDGYDVQNISDEKYLDDLSWRDAVEYWLCKDASDFSEIIDFSASLEVDGETVDIPWQDEENGLIYSDCVYGEE